MMKPRASESQEASIHINLRKLFSKCEALLSGHIENEANFFELLDPLVSDTQCHIHCLLILDILYKFYSSNATRNIEGFKGLKEEDKDVLSCAVLLSLLKFQQKDEFGIVIHERSLEHLGGHLCSSIKKEKKLINEAKQYFNSRSIDFIKSVASDRGEIKTVFDKCQASVRHSGLKLKSLPCYATNYATMRRMKEEKLPIIISLVRIRGKMAEGSYKHAVGKCGAFFYEFQEHQKTFCYKSLEDLSSLEKSQPTIVLSCYSITDEHPGDDFNTKYQNYMDGTELPSNKFLTDMCDVSNLHTLCAAAHIQLPKEARIPNECEIEEYVKSLYADHSDNSEKLIYSLESKCALKGSDIYSEYAAHYELAVKCNMLNVRYLEYGGAIKRRKENTFFAIEHIRLSNYLLESKRMKALNINAEVDANKVYKVDNGNTGRSVLKVLECLGFL